MRKGIGVSVNLPAWLEPYREQWDGFCEMRELMQKRWKIPWTQRAMKLIIGDLLKLMQEGEDIGKCLDQSTKRGWRGVFEVKDKQSKEVSHVDQRRSPESFTERNVRESREALKRVRFAAGEVDGLMGRRVPKLPS